MTLGGRPPSLSKTFSSQHDTSLVWRESEIGVPHLLTFTCQYGKFLKPLHGGVTVWRARWIGTPHWTVNTYRGRFGPDGDRKFKIHLFLVVYTFCIGWWEMRFPFPLLDAVTLYPPTCGHILHKRRIAQIGHLTQQRQPNIVLAFVSDTPVASFMYFMASSYEEIFWCSSSPFDACFSAGDMSSCVKEPRAWKYKKVDCNTAWNLHLQETSGLWEIFFFCHVARLTILFSMRSCCKRFSSASFLTSKSSISLFFLSSYTLLSNCPSSLRAVSLANWASLFIVCKSFSSCLAL